MNIQAQALTAIVARPVQGDGLAAAFLPDFLRPSVRVGLIPTPPSKGARHALTASCPPAPAPDRGRAQTSRRLKPSLDEMLSDPMVRLLMRSDGVSDNFIRNLVSHMPDRTPAHAE